LNDLCRYVPQEVPRFGEFARQFAHVRSDQLVACLREQQRYYQPIGRILVKAGLINSDQIRVILGQQASWAARNRSHDLAPDQFPIATTFSLCMPCFNEAETLEDVLVGAMAVLPHFVSEFEVIIVDDGSTDHTASVVEQWARSDDRIRLVRHGQNRGYGAAVASGLRAAHGELVCLTDGDGQFNLLDLPQLLVNSETSDVVIGYRRCRADNGIRRFNARSWNRLIRALTGLRVQDLDCAFKLFPRWVVDRLQLTADGACISAEILTQCARGGASLCEVPVSHYPRVAGKATGGNLKVVAKAFRELPIVWRYRRMPRWQGDGVRFKFAPAGCSIANGVALANGVAGAGSSTMPQAPAVVNSRTSNQNGDSGLEQQDTQCAAAGCR
jgi:hypothetical protein